MAVTHVANCPHCRTENVGMTYVATSVPRRSDPTVVFRCNSCLNLVCALLKSDSGMYHWIEQSAGNLDDVSRVNHARIQHVYPQQERAYAPEHVSNAVKRAFLQGEDNAARRQSDAAAAMYRKALDLATKELDAGLAGKNLAPRIDALHKAGKLTQDLKDWAHMIRLDGNHGAHDDEELTREEIAQLASFTELFLTYTFTLPAQVAGKKAAAVQAVGNGP
ncbi:DUF4145 domain-containing protein [Stenotrophomonas sp. CFBP 13725]|uniref:DUF4145 domain-containing protein n=1 Tax=Stenotrophomonas sp. CFBP 13725 TaxID=2775297 RepID=UPI00177A9ABB|nr:DUF4145 domain-containing protein [Stenotrophomonas sp. CFBP 13725]MBD8634757.1 DUF4145 domain-containing protein [Stenotrophomonas sp. CFBP 13725]